ncbi:MAG: Na+/H+ antiporter subunit E [Cyanobacteriota bacterium]
MGGKLARNLALRLTIWFLLTANLSFANIVIGVTVALLLPQGDSRQNDRLSEWLRVMAKVFASIPQAYAEAFEMILRPHKREEIVLQQVPPRRSPHLLFLDIFLITFTPKTIVLKYHEAGWFEVHHVTRRSRS